jgi:hypothetical protein
VAVSNSVRLPEQHLTCKMNKLKMAIGMCVHISLITIAVIVIMLSEYIVWADVRYHKKSGKYEKSREGGKMECIEVSCHEIDGSDTEKSEVQRLGQKSVFVAQA